MSQPPLGLTARASVNRIIDGDTIDVSLHLPIRVRLRDCWAPETHGGEKLKGESSKLFVETFLRNRDQVIIHVPSSEAQSLGDVLTFGRVLGDVFVDGQSLGEVIVDAGHATRSKP